MAHALGTDRKGSVNVELNIVPFIDLMSCLTAFLLVTAVWINLAHLKANPAGRNRDIPDQPEPPKLSILIEYDQILVTETPSGMARQVAAFDWAQLRDALKEFKLANETQHVDIAAASSDAHPIPYQSLIAAMDTSVQAGFPDIGVADPSSISR
jgi:biopolymer transport protein ExbD